MIDSEIYYEITPHMAVCNTQFTLRNGKVASKGITDIVALDDDEVMADTNTVPVYGYAISGDEITDWEHAKIVEKLESAAKLVQNKLSSSGSAKVLISCDTGKRKSGLFAAYYLVTRTGITPETAEAILSKLCPGAFTMKTHRALIAKVYQTKK